MEAAAYVTLFVVIITFGLLAWGRDPPDLICIGAIVVLWCSGIITAADLLAGWSNTGLATVIALYVVMGSVRTNRILSLITTKLLGVAKPNVDYSSNTYIRYNIFRQMLIGGVLSAFMNNTPLVAFFIPKIKEWARDHKIAPSPFLMPLTFGIIMGGLCTIVGTSTNLVVQSFLKQKKLPQLGFFEIGAVGVPAFFVGTFLMCLIGPWILPKDKGGMFRLVRERGSEFLTEIIVDPNSALIGHPLHKILHSIGLDDATPIKILRQRDSSEQPAVAVSVSPSEEKQRDIPLLDIDSPPGYRSIFPVSREEACQAGDRVVLVSPSSGIISAQLTNLSEEVGVHFIGLCNEDLNSMWDQFCELVLSHQNPLVGKLANDPHLVAEYQCTLLAVRRADHLWDNESDVSEDSHLLQDYTLRPGDALLVMASKEQVEGWREKNHSEFYTISRVRESVPAPTKLRRRFQEIASLLILLAVLVVGGGGILPMEQAAIVAACLVVLIRCIEPDEARNSIEWNIVLLIGASLGFGPAMEKSGLAKAIGSMLGSLNMPPRAALFIFQLVATLMTEIINNNACVALLFPIGLETSAAMGVSYRPFIVALLFAASAGFAVCTGYQCLLMIMAPGGYRFMDFVKIGLPLDFVYLFACWVIIPLVWPF